MSRIKGLDGLRGVAVVAVMVHHYWPTPNQWSYLGATGVDLFFVLSGFLITWILLSLRDRPRGRVLLAFALRRILRLAPPWFILLFGLYLLGYPELRSGEALYWAQAYLINVFMVIRGNWAGHISHGWSLAVEEQFYLIWPWLMLLVHRRFLSPLMVALLVSAPVWGAFCLWSLAPEVGETRAYFAYFMLPIGCFDRLAGGALLAYLYVFKAPGVMEEVAGMGLLLGIIVLFLHFPLFLWPHGGGLAASATSPVWSTAVGLVFMWVVTHVVLASGEGSPVLRILEWRPLAYVGQVSYGIYLYHHPLVWVRDELLGLSEVWPPTFGWRLLLGVLTAMASVGLASVSWFALERPLGRLKRFIPYVAEEEVQAVPPRPTMSRSWLN